jgi:hypothetical protein
MPQPWLVSSLRACLCLGIGVWPRPHHQQHPTCM